MGASAALRSRQSGQTGAHPHPARRRPSLCGSGEALSLGLAHTLPLAARRATEADIEAAIRVRSWCASRAGEWQRIDWAAEPLVPYAEAAGDAPLPAHMKCSAGGSNKSYGSNHAQRALRL